MKKSKKIKKDTGQKGIALLLTVIVLSVVMFIVVLIVAIVAAQIKLANDINDSAAAIYAADSGIEWQLYKIRHGASVSSPTMSNGADISVTVIGDYPTFTIKSLGSFRTVKRQLEANF